MKKKKNRAAFKQGFAIFMLIIFLISPFGFVLFYNPSSNQPSQGTIDQQIVTQNILTSPVEFTTKQFAITPQNPSTFPPEHQDRALGGIWIEYSCRDCTDLIDDLTRLVNEYLPRVYISPGSRNETLYLLSNQGAIFLDEFEETEVEDFICNNLFLPPDKCALRTFEQQPTLPQEPEENATEPINNLASE